jgi:superfamily I DNA/RNA helicase
VASGEVGLGDIGVFLPFARSVSGMIKRLGDHDIPALNLEKYEGVPADKVKVGSYKRAKGLEFKVVILPRVKAGSVPKKQGKNQSDEEYAEQRGLAVNEFYVAMTRPRDQLIVTFGSDPSELLLEAMDAFDTVTPEDL